MPPEGWLNNCKLERLGKKQGENLRSTDYANDLAKLIARLAQTMAELPGRTGGGVAANHNQAPPHAAGPVRGPELHPHQHVHRPGDGTGRTRRLGRLGRSGDGRRGDRRAGQDASPGNGCTSAATYAIPDLAGRVWWSFYERGTSMAAFVRHALAYITGQDPDTLAKETSHYQRCQELLTELKYRPFLLVLDGFERVLTAYHRWDKAQQRDDKIETELRECTDPRDGELLQQLLHGSPSKIILSTRLFPSTLQDRAGIRPIPGVAHHKLNGLSRPDTLDFFRHAGIKGNEQAMLDFAEQFGGTACCSWWCAVRSRSIRGGRSTSMRGGRTGLRRQAEVERTRFAAETKPHIAFLRWRDWTRISGSCSVASRYFRRTWVTTRSLRSTRSCRQSPQRSRIRETPKEGRTGMISTTRTSKNGWRITKRVRTPFASIKLCCRRTLGRPSTNRRS